MKNINKNDPLPELCVNERTAVSARAHDWEERFKKDVYVKH